MTTLPDNIEYLLHEATNHLQDITSILDGLSEDSSDDDGSSTEDKVLSIQLILQYRLSGEDVLSKLLKMDQHLLYFLGIQPHHSAKMNLDRLAYAVGNEDLKQILNVLAILVGSLSKMTARYKASHATFDPKNKKTAKQHGILKDITKLVAKQQLVLDVIHRLNLEILQMENLNQQNLDLAQIEQLNQLNLDIEKTTNNQHVFGARVVLAKTLREKISYFEHMITHNLGQAKQLYHQVNQSQCLTIKLNTLLQETENILHLMPNVYHPHYPIKQFDHPIKQVDPQTNAQQLEQRAALKRLRPFFG